MNLLILLVIFWILIKFFSSCAPNVYDVWATEREKERKMAISRKIHYGRHPGILAIEHELREELKRHIIEKHGEDGQLWSSGSMTMSEFLSGKQNKPYKVSVQDVIKDIDRPTISYGNEGD